MNRLKPECHLLQLVDGLKMWYHWLHQVIRGKEGYQWQGHIRLRIDLSDLWKSNCATLPGFTYVLRAVLTNSPNSCPSERLFSIFNTTYNDDQKSSYTDYIELSMESQFNKKGLDERKIIWGIDFCLFHLWVGVYLYQNKKCQAKTMMRRKSDKPLK
jgi:hypothetical protein